MATAVALGTVAACAWCGKIRRSNGVWAAPLTPPVRGRLSTLMLRPTTHGICPECFEREMARLHELAARRQGA